MNHDVEDDSGRPHVRLEIVALSGVNFRGHIRGCTDLLLFTLSARNSFLLVTFVKADAEISNLDFSAVVDQDIFELYVAVNDLLGVNISQAYDDLSEHVFG